jgi:hypothetical protein
MRNISGEWRKKIGSTHEGGKRRKRLEREHGGNGNGTWSNGGRSRGS